MYSFGELSVLIDLSGQVWRMTDGYHVSIRAELRDSNPNRPHGLDYGLTLMDPGKVRILGFDNRHKYDGAGPDEPYDHEHRRDVPRRTFAYEFRSAGDLMTDFFDRVDDYIKAHQGRTGRRLEFEEGSLS